MPKKNKSVLQAEKIANELYEKQYGNTSEEAPKKPEVNRELITQTIAKPVEPEVTETEIEQPQVEQNESVQNEEPKKESVVSDFEQKYKVLEGKYNAEVPRMAQENRSLKEELDSLKLQVANLHNKPEEPKAEVTPLITEKDREQFGDDLIEVMKRASREVMSERQESSDVQNLKDELSNLRKQQSNSQELQFYEKLSTLFPDWRLKNEDAGFLKWLDEIDSFSGRTRQSLLNEASGNFDAPRVANFFNSYFGQMQPEPSTSKPSLEDQVTPKTTGRTTVPPAKKYYTNRDIVNFYAKVRTGEISKAEAERIERDIFKAQSEERIRAG